MNFINKHNITTSWKPLHTVSKYSGISKICYKEYGIIDSKNAWHTSYSIFLTILIVISFVYGFIECLFDFFLTLPIPIMVTEILINLTLCISVILAIIMSITHKNAYWKFVMNLKYIDENLSISENYFTNFHKNLSIALSIFLIYYPTFSILNYLGWQYINNTVLHFWYYFMSFIVDLTILEYAFAIIEIANRVKIINAYVCNYMLKDYRSDRFLDLNFCAEYRQNHLVSEYETFDLEKLMISYEKLIENIDLMNSVYGPQVME